MEIIPAIIPRSADHVREALAVTSFAETVQIDLVDGQFAAPASWPYEPTGMVADVADALTGRSIEIDLMVEHGIDAARVWQEVGVRRFVFHLEALADTHELAALRAAGCTVGISISNDTPLTVLTDVLESADFVQLMGIATIGSQGQPFDERVLGRIRELRSMYPNLTISIDGAVTKDTLPRLIDAGADRFAVGSGILAASDPEVAYRELVSLLPE